MQNNFFTDSLDKKTIALRLKELEDGKVGFYSVGLYPASLAYNCAMQTNKNNLLLAPRPGRNLLGAFSKQSINELKEEYLNKMIEMSTYKDGSKIRAYTLSDLIEICDLVVLSSNSNHIESDLQEALHLRDKLGRTNVVLACLVGSFTYGNSEQSSFLLCQKNSHLAFFSGFHRHGALRNPLDSFTANFCHPDSFTALIGARLLNNLSPNIQVSSGVHNVEGQYIKSAKNVSSIFAGFGHTYHCNNPGLLPTLLTLLLNQCLDQAATVSMSRLDRNDLYKKSSLSLTDIGYGVQRIEAALSRDGDMEKVRDHTFSQLTAMIADVKGSMMLPISGSPTRNFQVGQILADRMMSLKRCPNDLDELINWCESKGLQKGALEGINSLRFWPDILRAYSIPNHDSSMINLLYMCIFSSLECKRHVFNVMTNSRELTNFCQESVRPKNSSRMNELLNNLDKNDILSFLCESIYTNNFESKDIHSLYLSLNIHESSQENNSVNSHLEVINMFDKYFSN
ncbi:hypothetical protein [Prochlorococcus marinus]|uniref:hypothetical protein n=1 Tax=Prochlorococcus marinus TaxID=1219 RepID=UPI0022B4FC11|nr:hypothetical protein [Prochlorococcus marinus]